VGLPPQALITLTLAAIISPKDLAARALLSHFLAEGAIIDSEPALDLESQLSAIAPRREVVQIFADEKVHLSPGPTESRTSSSCLIQDGKSNSYRITLTRADSDPHLSCWLIASIDPDKDTS
jgi:hypothetical protein